MIAFAALFDYLLSWSNNSMNFSLSEQFWLVVHGMAGCGKSSLVAEVLRTCPEILSR